MPLSPLRFALVAFLGLVTPAFAHEGHDHGAPPPPVSATIAPRADASSADLELVAVARGGRLEIHLDRFRTNEPVPDATIEIDSPAGVLTATAQGPGVYVVEAPFAAAPGAYDLAFTVTAGETVDVLTATLTIPPPPAAPVAAPALREQAEARLRETIAGLSPADARLWGVAALAFLAGLLTARLGRRAPASAASLALALLGGLALFAADEARAAGPPPPAARDVAQRFPDGSLFVPKPTQHILGLRTEFTQERAWPLAVELPARIIPDPDGAGHVQASVAGRLAPPTGGFPRLGAKVSAGDVLAYVEPAVGAADVTSQQQQARELDQQIAVATRRLERLKAIQSVVARAQIEDAELELAGLRARRANLDGAPRRREPLVAPVTGVVAAAQAVAGQIVEPNAVIWQIVDPARFWVEALSYEPQAIGAAATGRLADERALELDYRGAGLADRNQAIPIHFSIRGAPDALRAGQLLTVHAVTAEERRGVALPRAAVLRGANGQKLVFEHTNPERFTPREVRVEPLDATRVLVVSGVAAGARIVTEGAELLNQIR